MGDRTGDGFYVVGKSLRAVVQSSVQHGDPVVALVVEVKAVRVFHESGAEAQGYSTLKIPIKNNLYL